jgi:lactate dehydrogenase-like 2-hydroxyacid dehydrogenase
MTAPIAAKRPTILIPGKMHAHAVTRIADAFDVITAERAEAALLNAAERDAITGIAVIGRVDAAIIDALPNLSIISNFGVGYDGVDAVHAAAKGVIVTHTPGVLDEEVADTAIGLLLNTLRELPKAEAYLRAGRWVQDGPYPLTGLTLRGRRVGIAGLGRIGKAIARRLEGFGVSIAYHNRRPDPTISHRYFDTLAKLASEVDTLISVLPGTPETAKITGKAVFDALGPEGVFINIGRGATVDEEALIAALKSGAIAAAGLDVFEDEPRVRPELLDLPNVCLLPHVASASQATRRAMADLVADNLERFFSDGTVLTPVPECQGFARYSAA